MRILLLAVILATTALGADFTTYIGDANQYQVTAVASDAAGNTYVTGGRVIPVAAGYPLSDVFVTKLDLSGNIVFTTTFGGKENDMGSAVATDAVGNIWVGGTTSSEDFPLRGALQTAIGMGTTGFLVKLAPDGTVIYSSYFGGTLGYSSVNGVATDQSGNVYVAGETDSSDFPATPGLPAGTVNSSGSYVTSGAFITKLDSTGTQVLYSGLIAGSVVDCSGGSSCFLMDRTTGAVGVAVDGAGEAFIAGNTNTLDLPVTPGGMSGLGAFAAKINAAGSQLAYLTYLGPPGGVAIVDYGPSAWITGYAITVDSSGDAYLTGSTNDTNFPATPGAFQTMSNSATSTGGLTNAFALKLDPAGAIVWATFLGGPGSDAGNAIATDGSGDVWLTGTNATGFPSATPGSTLAAGNFLAELSPAGSKLLYSADLATAGQGIALDPSGVLHVSSENGLVSTITPGQPFAPRIMGIANSAQGQVSGRIAPSEVVSIFGSGLGPSTPVSAAPENGSFPTTLAGVQVLVNGVPIPLLYVSSSQINAEIPSPLSGVVNDSALIQVINGSAMLPDFRVSVDDIIFGIFINSDGSAKAVNQDGTVNSQSKPAPAGSIVSVWGTGLANPIAPVTGAVEASAADWCSYCEVTIGSISQTVDYAGAAPGLIDGVMQINFMTPETGGSSATQVSFEFSLGGAAFIWVEGN